MSGLNGDSKTIIKLLSEKIDNSNKQINQRFDDFQKYQDNIIASFNTYKETTKKYIDMRHKEQEDELKEQKKMIDNHFSHIRKLENFRWYLLGIGAVITSLGLLTGVWKLLT